MSLLGFLSGVGSLFSGGSDKSNTKSNLTQSTSSSSEQAATAQEDTKSTTTANTSASGSSTTTGTGSTTQTGKESTTQQNTTTNYSASVLASLDALLSEQMGNGNAQQGADTLSQRLKEITAQASKPGFDVEGYVSGIAKAASVDQQNALDSNINQILSRTGTSESGNSMSALLANKLRGEASANLAGIVSQAQATGAQIKNAEQESFTSQISGLSNDISGQLAQLLSAAKGGTSTSTGTQDTTSQQAQQSQQTQQTQEQQQQQSTQNTNSSTSQQGVTQTTGKETTTQKGSTSTQKGDLFSRITDALSKSSAAA